MRGDELADVTPTPLVLPPTVPVAVFSDGKYEGHSAREVAAFKTAS